MNESQIKLSLSNFLEIQSKNKRLALLDELRIAGGDARADIVQISDKLECYEIKSESDSLKRLVRQGWFYGRVFDKVYLVAAKKHIDPAMKLIPQWWGVMEISGDNDFKLIRKAKQNPEQDIEGIAELFSKTEIEDILSSADALKGFRGKSLLVLRSRILELYKKKQLKVQLCEMLKVRYQNHLSSQTLCGVE